MSDQSKSFKIKSKRPVMRTAPLQRQKISFRTLSVTAFSLLTCLVAGWIIFFNTVNVDTAKAKGAIEMADQQFITDMTLPSPVIISNEPLGKDVMMTRQAKPMEDSE
jgi:hypothetical protein